jgi:iron complex outermembrane receptor protein
MRRTVFWAATLSTVSYVSCAAAATTGGDAGKVALEEVVVSGVRQSLEQAIDTKRAANTVVDAISAEDVGKFPTENVAESLQRVTGVQIARLRGEGQQVTIRGLPTEFTLVQLNGRTLTSALGPSSQGISRSFDFTILPSEFVSRLEVFKSPTADLEEGGLSGTVIARTVRPLDIGKFKLAGNVQYADESNRGEWSPRASGLYSDTFADGMFGVALGVAYTERKSESHEQRITRFRRAPESAQGGLDLNGNGVIEDGRGGRPLNNTPYAMLDSIFHGIFREDRKRTTSIGTLQLRPNDHWDFVAEGFYSKLDSLALNYSDLLRVGIGLAPPAQGGRVVPGSIVVNPRPGNSSAVGDGGLPVQTLEAARFQGVDERGDGRVETREGDLKSFSLGGAYHGESWEASLEFGYSAARQTRSNPLLENQRRADLAYDIQTNQDLVSYSFGGNDNALRLDPSTYQLLGFNGEWNRHREDEQKDVSIDVTKEFNWGWIDGLKFGGRYAERSVYEDARRIQASTAQLAPLWNGQQPNLFLVEVRPSNGQFLDADGNTSGLFHQSWLVNDPRAFIRAYGRERIEALSTITNDPSGITDVTEDTSALYLRTDLVRPNGVFSGNIGLRVVRTQQTSVGISPDLNGITFEPQAGSATRVPPAQPFAVDRSYVDYLPSLNLKFDLTDDLVARFAAARTMSRPSLSQISPTVTASGTTQSLTANNPELDPFRANNFDVSAEWYFGRGGLLATTLFYKEIVSQVIREQTQIPLTITQINADGSRTPLNQTWTLSRLVNGAGTAVSGAEFSYQQNFDFLPAPLDGFGFLGNYTYLESHGRQRLQGASRNNYTASLYYEKRWFGTRLTYTYRDEFYSGVEGNSQDNLIEQAFGTLDGTLTVNVNDNLSVVLEATNILEDTNRTRFEPIDITQFYTDNGRRVLLGVRASF